MRLYSRIYKYHLQVRLFALTTLVYAESLKNIKNFKTSSILCEAKIDEESREQTTVAAAEAKQQRSKPKNPQETTKTMKECFETTNARKKTYIKKTKNIYAYICEDEEEEREFKKLTLHKWNADAAEGDELRVRTRNEDKDEKESLKLCVARFKI